MMWGSMEDLSTLQVIASVNIYMPVNINKGLVLLNTLLADSVQGCFAWENVQSLTGFDRVPMKSAVITSYKTGQKCIR